MRFLDISTGDSTVSIVFEYYYKSSSNSYLNENKLGVVQKSELKDLMDEQIIKVGKKLSYTQLIKLLIDKYNESF